MKLLKKVFMIGVIIVLGTMSSIYAAGYKIDGGNGNFEYGLIAGFLGDKQYSKVTHKKKAHSASTKVQRCKESMKTVRKTASKGKVAYAESQKWGCVSKRNSYYDFW